MIFPRQKSGITATTFLISPSYPTRSLMSGEEFALGPTKLLRVCVSTPRLCLRAFSSARWFHTKLILCIPPFSVKRSCFALEILPNHEATFLQKKGAHNKKRVPVGAGQESRCEVRVLSYSSLLCVATFHAAAAASLRVCWKFWDIWHISHFPAVPVVIQGLTCLAGNSSNIYSSIRSVFG